MFRGYLPRNFLILALLLLVLWIATKFTFITITLEEYNIALHGKNNMQHLHTPTWNWCTYWDNVRRHHCIMWEKIISIICIYLPETLPKVPFLSLNFSSQNRSLAVSIIWNIWMSNENSPQKRMAKLKTVINNCN